MKIKSIMYALGCGKSRKDLVRSEGARRVKLAETMWKWRKTVIYTHLYGSSGKSVGTKFRSVSVPKTFGVPYGKDIGIVYEGLCDKVSAEMGEVTWREIS